MLIVFLVKLILRWIDSEVLKGRLLAVEARTAHDRFGLTHKGIVREARTIRKAIRHHRRPLHERNESYAPNDQDLTVAMCQLQHDCDKQGIMNILNLEDTPQKHLRLRD